MTVQTYGPAHHRQRDRLKPYVDSGQAECTEVVCLLPSRAILPGMKWDLAHDRTRPGQYLGPAHQRCNRAEGATFGNEQRGKPRRAWVL